MMQIKNLSYHYKGSPEVLKDVTFDIEPGKFLAILGNNGVGKSTLLKCFNHILKPDAGEVLLDGEDLLKTSVTKCTQHPDDRSRCGNAGPQTLYEMGIYGRGSYHRP